MYPACQVILSKNPWDLNRFNVIPHFLGWYVRVPSVWLLLSKWYDSALVLCLWVRSCCLGIRYVTVVAVLLTHTQKKERKKNHCFSQIQNHEKTYQPVFSTASKINIFTLFLLTIFPDSSSQIVMNIYVMFKHYFVFGRILWTFF